MNDGDDADPTVDDSFSPISEQTRREREEQGLPPTIQDPAIYELLAAVFSRPTGHRDDQSDEELA